MAAPTMPEPLCPGFLSNETRDIPRLTLSHDLSALHVHWTGGSGVRIPVTAAGIRVLHQILLAAHDSRIGAAGRPLQHTIDQILPHAAKATDEAIASWLAAGGKVKTARRKWSDMTLEDLGL